MRLSFSTADLAASPTIEFEVELGLNASYGFQPMQGMRIHMMPGKHHAIAISAASCTGPYDGQWTMHFSLLRLHATTGELQWAKIYKKPTRSLLQTY